MLLRLLRWVWFQVLGCQAVAMAPNEGEKGDRVGLGGWMDGGGGAACTATALTLQGGEGGGCKGRDPGCSSEGGGCSCIGSKGREAGPGGSSAYPTHKSVEEAGH